MCPSVGRHFGSAAGLSAVRVAFCVIEIVIMLNAKIRVSYSMTENWDRGQQVVTMASPTVKSSCNVHWLATIMRMF